MRYCFFLMMCFVAVSCTHRISESENSNTKTDSILVKNSKTKTQSDSAKIDPILEKCFDLINNLPEVNAQNKYIDSISNHKRGIVLLLYQKPDSIFPYYWIKAGDNLELNYNTYYNFYVNPQTFEVRYLDVLSDSVDATLSLKEWRGKRKSNPLYK